MSLIKRAKKYLILISVVMTTILIFLCYISSSFSYIVDHKKDNNNYIQTNKNYKNSLPSVRNPTGKENLISKSKGDNSSSIVLSMKEYNDLLADVERNRKMLMDSIWSKTIQNAKELKRQKNYLDNSVKLTTSLDRNVATLTTVKSTVVPNFNGNKYDNVQSQDKKENFDNSKLIETGNKYHEFSEKNENDPINQEKSTNTLPDMDGKITNINQEGRQLDHKNHVKKYWYQEEMEKQRFHGNYRNHDKRQNIKSIESDKGENMNRNGDFQRRGKVLNELKKLALGQTSRFVSVRGGSNKNEEQSDNSDKKLRKDDCESCIHNNFKYMINQETLCKHKADIDVLFVILTAPDEFIQRSTIRKTWGTECTKKNLACMFILGNVFNTEINDRLVQESKEFHDIVQFDFKEAYANLTYKTLSGLRWASEYCQTARYIMKTDGDMYVNTELIPTMLQAAPKRDFMGGNCWGLSSPHREPESKWYVSFNSYPKSKFPPMCSGTGYIMSADVLTGILKKSRNIPFFHLEDVYIALCTQKLSVVPINLQGFSNMRQSFSPCYYRNSVMTSHYVSPEVLREYWSESRTCALENQKPDRLFQKIPYPQVT